MIAPPTIAPIAIPSTTTERTAGAGPDVGKQFAEALENARSLEHSSETASKKFADGDPSIGIHEVVIEAEKASIALRYATTLKNKAIEAYRELMSTQV